MAETYTLKVAGLTRELTICKVNDHMDIAAFIMLGDTELTVAAAAELLKKCPDFDILLTAEAKGIPLAHEMSRQSGKPYVCARKNVKLYMKDPVIVEDQSITTEGKQKLVIDRKELDEMSGKRVLVVDDVISTGGSLKALDALAEQTHCEIVGQAAVLAVWFCGPGAGSGRPGPRLWPLAAAGRSAGPGLFGAHRRTVQRPDGTVRRPDGAADRHGGGRPGGIHPRHRPRAAAGRDGGRGGCGLLLSVRRPAPVRGGGNDRGLV